MGARRFCFLISAFFLLAAPPAIAQAPDGARREGTLNLYTSLPVDDITELNTAFEKRTGIKVRTWRASSEKVVLGGTAAALLKL